MVLKEHGTSMARGGGQLRQASTSARTNLLREALRHSRRISTPQPSSASIEARIVNLEHIAEIHPCRRVIKSSCCKSGMRLKLKAATIEPVAVRVNGRTDL